MDSRLDKLKQSLESAVEGMSSEQLSWHLPGKWCATEVLEHLYLTYAGTTKGFEKVITSGQPLATRAWRRSLLFVPRSYSGCAESVIVELKLELLMLPYVLASV